ncbi:probable glycerol kinase [Thermoplasma acidophilum]|uniref:ATP:glycerol 3-phosphotransferase n=1 Tax=Thermoplasma acidophilum (strain ATCC 25905 / DSM 1728 / JCM 9062 / NBRC 15155 / AMRC-C165) TaxID=273075 RepID=Q9HJ76_THEAC|nr:glycerol kinase GlpK [Thermoplasma acidophilum]CAC12223.1 probable glycerol kinase [Thermoplasma acidophilum]
MDANGRIVSFAYRLNRQYFPAPGWVEQDPVNLWRNVRITLKKAIEESRIDLTGIASAGVTNQRETVLVWDRKTGRPLYNAIVWQDKRTSRRIKDLDEETSNSIMKTTGLRPDSYFSASKIQWLLENVEGLRKKMADGDVSFGTVDSWIIWNLNGSVNRSITVTDHSNASRTMLYDIAKLRWNPDLLDIFGGISETSLPEVMSSGSAEYGYISKDTSAIFDGREVPITADIGDQQSALFGQGCFNPGDVKATYGTGTFILSNAGTEVPQTSGTLLRTIFYSISGRELSYALEGSILASGSVLRWLQNSLHLFRSAKDIEDAAEKLKSNDGVYFVPAFSGLGSPYWDQDARGLFIGLTESTTADHLARSVLESEVYMATDVIMEIEKEIGRNIAKIRCDGGGSRSDFLMQFQADIANAEVLVPESSETTALGSAYLSGLVSGLWKSKDEIRELWRLKKVYRPVMSEEERKRNYVGWKDAVKRCMGWHPNI